MIRRAGAVALVAVLDGITLRAVEGENNTTGSTSLCALTTYAFGGPADTWGHAGWTTSQLGASTFRVRITDVPTVTTKKFKLDYLGVAVQYTP